MINDLTSALSLTLIGILAFYSADVIWRERTAKFNQIIDAMPTPNWVFVTSKVLVLVLILVSIVVLGIVMAIAIQASKGYMDFELGMYFERGFFYFILPFICLAILACFFQVLANNRFVGMSFLGLYIIYIAGLSMLGFEHPLLHFALGGIAAPISDMNGSGRFIIGGYWMRFYWVSIAGLLLIATYLLWKRGTIQPLKYRLTKAVQNKPKQLAYASYALLALTLGSGSYIFYNTNILNEYQTQQDILELKLAYEKQYRQYEDLPMPHIVDVKIDVDIYPEQHRIEARSTQILENKTQQDIKTVHVVFPTDLQVPMVELQGAVQKSAVHKLGYYIFNLAEVMKPGETRELKFETAMQHQGFVHNRADYKLVANGTFIGSNHLTPDIGFSHSLLISNRNARREYGLPPLPRTPKLEDTHKHNTNYVSHDSHFINFETTVSTSAGQKAVSNGRLVKQWAREDRNYFNYKMDVPMMNFYAFLSADYEVVTDQWQQVDIQIFHHDKHTYNLNRMMSSVKDSLSYFSEAFGEYQYQQLRIVEFPAYRKFARAYAGFIPFSEGAGFVADLSDPRHIDLPYYVTAHEVAHQWWAHQVMAANAQGGTMLIESLAQYSALLVMERKYGKHQVRKYLKFELDKYLSKRSSDPEGELPLFKVENQKYIHYHKGAVVLYALRDYIGEEGVNRALKKLVKNHAYQTSPYAVSTDLISYLKQESGSEYHALIEDSLQKITVFDLKVKQSSVEEMADGRFKVSIDVEAGKYYEDAIGNQTQGEMNIPIDIGLFVKNPANRAFESANVVLLEKRYIGAEKSTIEIIVDEKPTVVGIDPYNKLIDRNSDDNLAEVKYLETN